MTCIVGWLEDNKVWIGGDSAGVSNFSMMPRADKKVFKNGSFIFGFTSSFRMGQLLRFSFNPPVQHEGQDDYSFMCTDFINCVRDCLKAGGFNSIKDGVEAGGNFLVGYKGKLYEIEDDYQVGIPIAPYYAVGCGHDIAKGACFALEKSDIPVKDKILIALEASYQYSAGVRPPYVIECLEG